MEEAYADLDLLPGEARRPYTLINAVGTLDGRGAIAGKSTPIGSGADHRLMRNIRASVDAVLVGAGTLRREDLTLCVDEPLAKRRKQRGLEDQPLHIILSASGNIPVDRKVFGTNGESKVLIFTASNADHRQLAKLSDLATIRTASTPDALEPKKILQTLVNEFGVRRLLVEGGPTVNHSFLEAGLVNELFLTLAPKIVGGDIRALVEGEPLPQHATSHSLVSVYLFDSEIYLRYRLRHATPTSTSFREFPLSETE